VTSGDELSCQELVELVTDYLEDTLSPVDRARFEAHLGGCEACSIYLDQMRTTIRVAGSLSDDAIPRAARGGLLQAFRDWKRA
jgi:predicted anti-sigma-YlaC factor YlaD